jgi:hypothetical protein
MIGDSIGAAVGAEKRRKESQRERERAQDDRERAVEMAADATYDPFQVRDMIDPYQRSQSPVARGYLESFLTGSNPQAVQSIRATAPQQRAQLQGNFDQAYGGWDQLRAKQREMETSTPWATKALNREPVSQEMRQKAKYGMGAQRVLDRLGIGAEDIATLERMGISIDPRSGVLDGTSNAGDEEAKAINKMVEAGDRGMIERLMAAKRRGAADPALAQHMWQAR